MPIVNIELKFNDQGAVTGARNLTALSEAADKAQKSVSGVGDKGAASVSSLGKNAEVATAKIQGLATQILALVGAYKALQAASSFVSRTFDFSSNLEDSQIAIASVLGATNKIADSQGRMLEGAEKFNAAQQISAQMMEKIQVLALQTTANFDDIVQGVSGIIAPATKAGVAMEKLPQFAVTAAQAMTAMKVPVQQMRTEIEALLSGNINKAQDILATNLGITGEMVRNWQQQGTLVEELTKRLAIFAEAGEATAQTWSGLKSNMKDALDYLSTQTGKGLFEGAKQSYRELLALLVSTDQNKLGLNEDVKNLVEMMRELEDEIGNKLVEATKDFVEIIKELNKPENTEELKQSLKSIGSLLSDVGSAISSISGMAFGVVRDLNSEFQSLPEDLRTFGLIGLMLFGRTGPAKMLAAVAAAYVEAPKVGASIAAQIAGIFGQDVAVSSDGSAASKQYWANRQEEYRAKVTGISKDDINSTFYGKSDTINAIVAESTRKQYTLNNSIGGFDNKKSGGTDKIANAREQIQKLREEIDALNGEATKKSNGLDQKEREIAKLGKSAGLSAAEVAQLQDDYAEAFKTNTLKEFNKHLMEVEGNTKALRDIKIDEEMTKWQSSFNELVARGKMSSEEATESLTRMKTALVNQSEVKDLQTAVQFYKELGELSGQYGLGIEIQNRLLKEQARAWKQAGIPDELVAEMVKLKQLQDSVNGFDGAYRGLVKFTAEYSNEAKQWESITYSWATGFNDTTKDMWGDFLDTGKVSFDQMSLSFTKLLKDMSYQALVQPIVVSIVGMARDSIYGMTTAGQSGGGSSGSSNVYGMASGMAQQYATGQMMNGLTSGFGDTINGWAASAFPSTFAPTAGAAYATPEAALYAEQYGLSASTQMGPTTTFTGALSNFTPGFIGTGIGTLASPYFNNLVGLQNNSGSQTGAMVGGLGSAAVLGTLAAANIWNPGGWVLGGLAGLSAIAGGSIGSLFGGGGSEPGLWLDTNLNLLGDMDTQTIQSIVGPNKGRGGFADAGGMGYYVQTRAKNGMDYSSAKSSAQYLEQLAQQAVALSTGVKSTLSGLSSSLGDEYINALRPMAWLHAGADGEGGDTPNAEQLGKNMMNLVYGRITAAVAQTDLSKLAIAADGMVADTMDEVTSTITKAVGVINIGASMGDYQAQYTDAISGKILEALNAVDLRNLALTVDKSSLAGWSAAATAIQAMDGVKTSINNILNPASELTTAMDAATAQMDGWIASLKQLGWQESAIADIESRRSAYMDTYYQAIARGAEQNIYMRSMALSAGTDSWAYQSQSLRYQQENELNDAKKKYGTDSDIYKTLVATQQAESIQAEIDYLQKQYNSMLQEQISSAQSLVNSFDRVVDSLDEARRNIWNSDANISTSRLADARSDFSAVYAKAMAGDADAMAELPSISTNLLNLGKEQIASRDVYQDLFYDVDAKLKSAQGIAKNQYDTNKSQLDTLQSQLSTQQAGNLTLAEISGKITTLSSSLATMTTNLMSMSQITKEAQASTTNLWAPAANTTQSQMDKLLADKAAQANAQASGGRTDWTASDIAQNIAKAGESVESWWAKYGVAEAVPTSYTSTTSKYGSDMALLAAKAADANKYAADGKTNWTAADIAQNIANAGMTISEWYSRHGKIEGYATGGITPANKPFLVGENGPELVVSPQQWGVINNTDSMALMRGMSGGGNINSGAIVAAINNMNDTLRQLLTKTDRIMADQGRIRDRMDMFAQEGVTIAAA